MRRNRSGRILSGPSSLVFEREAVFVFPPRLNSEQRKATLLTVFHGDSTFTNCREGQPASQRDDLALRKLLRLSDVWITLRSLRSQMVGEVRGRATSADATHFMQLCVHRGPALGSLAVNSSSRATPLQYKLEETGLLKSWSKGSGGGFV
jgi:hypothetical protein